MRIIEFFSGIGGVHAAFEKLDLSYEVVCAFDINDIANKVYQHNFSNKCMNKTIESISGEFLRKFNADVWTMSPPCQPYTRIGNMLDLSDRRANAMKHVIELIKEVQPEYIFFENVKGFDESNGRNLLLQSLLSVGYLFKEFLLSPLQFGVPNGRLRYYLLARKSNLYKKSSNSIFNKTNDEIQKHPHFSEIPISDCKCPVCMKMTEHLKDDYQIHFDGHMEFCNNIKDYLITPDELKLCNDDEEKYWYLSDDIVTKNYPRMDICKIDSDARYRRTSCFIKCYTRKLEGAGSVLQMISIDEERKLKEKLENGEISELEFAKSLKLRFFTPREVANFMCFPDHFKFPPDITRKQRYRLIGNSVNVTVVQHLLHWLFTS